MKLQRILLVENVVLLQPSTLLHAELDNAFGFTSFVVDAASWGDVSRPRLWWSNVLCLQLAPRVVLAGEARWLVKVQPQLATHSRA